MVTSLKDIFLRLSVLLLFYDCATCLIIPEELPTILSLIYSNIPPIKKGTDSRVGLGFRLGEHADFQVLLELGPQTETQPIGNADSKKRRAALTNSINTRRGPFIDESERQAQLERMIQRFKEMREKLRKSSGERNETEETAGSKWLTKWREQMQSTDT